MEETPFDPYYRWLGIPASEQPADHYRLLGIVRFESNREIIDNASLRQISFVRTFALGEHAEHSQTLLNELAAARSILLNPASKETYDESLREQEKHSEPELAPSPNFPDAEVLSSHSSTVDIDPTSVVHAKLQRQENQDPSKPNLSVLLGSFILIISAGLLWGLIRVGQSTIKFISGPPPLAVAPFDAEQAKAHQEAWAEHLGIEVEVTNSIGMKLRVIPPGTYVDGNLSGELRKLTATAEAETVQLNSPFLLSTCEISQEQYEEVMGSAPSDTKFADYPVVGVSWDDANEFCHRLSNLAEEKQKSRVYSLPSREQWTFSALAGDSEDETSVTAPEELDKIAWHRENSNIRRQPTGRLRPNNFGIFDCLGNANEWILTRTVGSPSQSKSYMGFAYCDSPGTYTFSVIHKPAETVNRGYPTVGFRVICALSND